MTTTTTPSRSAPQAAPARKRPPATPRPPRPPRRPEHDAPADMDACLSHTLTDGTIYAISGRFPHQAKLQGSCVAGMTVELYSQLRNPRINREARTTADATLPDGRRLTATHPLGSLNFTVARRIFTRHLLPDLLRQAANPHRI